MNIVAEYLMFFPNEGEFTVEAKFKSGAKRVSTRHASFKDVSNVIQLLSNQTDGQICVSFDEYPCEVTEVRIDLVRKRVHLSVNDL